MQKYEHFEQLFGAAPHARSERRGAASTSSANTSTTAEARVMPASLNLRRHRPCKAQRHARRPRLCRRSQRHGRARSERSRSLQGPRLGEIPCRRSFRHEKSGDAARRVRPLLFLHRSLRERALLLCRHRGLGSRRLSDACRHPPTTSSKRLSSARRSRENEYCGVNCGIMDQFRLGNGKKG